MTPNIWRGIFVAGVVAASPAFAGTPYDEASRKQAISEIFSKDKSSTERCPNPRKLAHLCMIIGSRMKAETARGYKYLYQERIADAACLKGSDEPEAAVQKIRAVWRQYEAGLHCSNSQFDVSNGSLLKFAVSEKFDDFLNDVIRWKINLNVVDATDGRTLLDYINFHAQRNAGNALEEKFRIYYEKFRRAGAKHESEIP